MVSKYQGKVPQHLRLFQSACFGKNRRLLAILSTLRVYGSPSYSISERNFRCRICDQKTRFWRVAEISEWVEDKNFWRFPDGERVPLIFKINTGVNGEKFMATDLEEIFTTPPPLNGSRWQRIRPRNSDWMSSTYSRRSRRSRRLTSFIPIRLLHFKFNT